jgi:hypothetical protein
MKIRIFKLLPLLFFSIILISCGVNRYDENLPTQHQMLKTEIILNNRQFKILHKKTICIYKEIIPKIIVLLENILHQGGGVFIRSLLIITMKFMKTGRIHIVLKLSGIMGTPRIWNLQRMDSYT